jgi:proteasome activator-like protein
MGSGSDVAGTAQQQAGQRTAVSRLAVVLDGPTAVPPTCRVEAADRVLRVWALLSAAHEELHQVMLPPGAVARLQRQLEVVRSELEQSVSPALADELSRLLRLPGATPATADELRTQYAGLLGWVSGVVLGMLSRVELASTGVATPPVAGSSQEGRRG